MNCCNHKKLSIKEMKQAHKLLAEFEYIPQEVQRGYANRTLYLNISENTMKIKPISEEIKQKFTGGRGFGLWYLWHAITPQTRWNDPENEIIISPGPIAGITQYPGAGKSYVVSLSPLTDLPIDSNVGGYFGPYLKFAGFDALEIQGKADKDIIIFIDGDNHKIYIEEAPMECVDSHILAEQLTEMYADSEEDKINVSVISSGKAAEHTRIGMLNFSYYDPWRKHTFLKQAGRGGIGTVFRDKKIKALVIKYSNLKGDSNNPVDVERIAKIGVKMHKEIRDLDHLQGRMRTVGTSKLVEIMNDYDLLPVNNFKYGSHPEAHKISSHVWNFSQGLPDGCWYGCTLQCAKKVEGFELKTGPYKGQKVIVDGPEYETAAGVGSNCGIFNRDAVLECNFYCDTYGIDTISFGTICAFVMECYENGIINKEITGGLELYFGNWEAQLEMLHQMARGEGFGKIAGQGIKRLKEIFVKEYGADENFLNDIGMEVKGLEYSEYVTKESLAQQGGYGMANKGPQHDESWLIFMDMVNKQIPTFEDKAEALFYFPLFRTWFSLVGLCKLPWNDIEPADNAEKDEPQKVPEHVQNYVEIFSAVTGKEITKEDIITQSEIVYNFQKVFNLRMGKGTRKYDDIPYRSAGPVTIEEYESRKERYDKQLKEEVGIDIHGMTTQEKIEALRKYRMEQYEKLRDVVYKRRGWTLDAVPKIETLKKLGIDYPEVVEVVKQYL